ncbi:MAG: 3-hydroxyacyl-ACP dehydratase FabZ [Limnochordia bacterium]
MFDISAIRRFLPHRYPMLLIDRVLEWEPVTRAVALKNVSINEPFFSGHYPDSPIMPGVLIVEAMAQTGGIAMLTGDESSALPILAGIDAARFRKLVVPGDQLRLEATVIRGGSRMGKVSVAATVDDGLVAQAQLLFTYMENPLHS